MPSSIDFTLSYDLQNFRLNLKLLEARLTNQYPEPFAKVQILPDRIMTSNKLEPLGDVEVAFTVLASDMATRTLEMIFFDVKRYKTPREFMGISVEFHHHECMGSVLIPLKDYDLRKKVNFREILVKCEDRGNKARNMCQLMCFEEDFRAFCAQFCKPSAHVIDFMNDKLINPVFKYLIENIERSRAPGLYFIGRSGVGKSSLINALANIHIAEVSDIEATPGMSKHYSIDFEGGACWRICDTRGSADSIMPDQRVEDPVTRVKQQVVEFNPDIILYVMSAKDVRNCLSELNSLSTSLHELQEMLGVIPSLVTIITHSDLIGKINEWPPEDYPSKQQQLSELLLATTTRLMNASGYSPINPKEPHRGYKMLGKIPVRYLIPVALPQEGIMWNIETLTTTLGQTLPTEARFQFYQPQKRPYLMREYSSQYIKYFSAAAAAVGVFPAPGSETLLLTALQILMVCVIGNLAGRDLSLTTAKEFMAAMGVTYVVGQGCLRVAQDLIKFVPIAGPLISASVSGAGTYAMGKSAQAYFFDGQKRNPSEFHAPTDTDGIQLQPAEAIIEERDL